ncbi:MAG: 50S ribosomal protein L25 [Planctomycetota bacterium]
MKVAKMKAERRTALGRNQIQKLRVEGWMPAVLYGGEGKEPVSLQISEWELDQHIGARHKVYDLVIDGQHESAFLQDVAWKAVNDRPLHADFLRIDLNKPLEAELEITLIGHPAGLSKGGALAKDNLKIRISALPVALPEAFELNISALNVGDSLSAKDLKLPEGVSLVTDGEMMICHVTGGKASADDEDEDGDS